MTPTRRDLLRRGAGAVALLSLGACAGKGEDTGPAEAAPSPARSPEPAPWSAPGALDATAFAWGLLTGDVGPDSLIVGLRSTEPAVTLVIMEAQGDAWVEVQRLAGLPLQEGHLRQVVSGLQPDTAYALAAYADADPDRRSLVARARTALAADGGRVVTFGATSCFGGNRPWPSLTQAAAEALDFQLLLGDTVYADGAVTLADYRAFWADYQSVSGLVDLCASTSLVATWDDHEVANNWVRSELPAGQFEAALQAFRESLPQGEGPAGTGVWRSLRWGRTLELFVLDCRGERDGSTLYLSTEQMDWLKAGLSASDARFKIIANSVPITDMTALAGTALAEDRWDGYPAQREEILRHIVDGGITGVLWVTGDVHFGQIGHIDPEGGLAHDLWEVYCGPAGSFLNPAAQLFVGDPQYPVMVPLWNWVRFTCDPGAGTIRVQHVGDDGLDLSDITLEL